MAPRAWWQYTPVAPSDIPDWSIQEAGEMVLVRGDSALEGDGACEKDGVLEIKVVASWRI